jgi:flagellar operon protein
MIINNRPIPSIKQVQNERSQSQPVKKAQVGGNPFQNVLQQQLERKEQLKFSKHANQRLSSRQIQLSDDQMVRLNTGVDKARAKGVKESLVLMDNIALVVNVENQTVVTALDQSEATDHVFTNIDGAVVI